MIRDKTLPPDMIMDLVPLCMDSVRYMLGSCRVPGLLTDSLTVTSNSRHVVVIRCVHAALRIRRDEQKTKPIYACI